MSGEQPKSILEQRQQERKAYCHNWMDKETPPKLHYGCDQEIVWHSKQKYNLDGTAHKCSHSNEFRSKANEAANNTMVEAIKKALNGTGKPPLEKPVDNLNVFAQEMYKDMDMLKTDIQQIKAFMGKLAKKFLEEGAK